MLTDAGYYYMGLPRYTEIDTPPAGQFMFVISAGHYKPLTLNVFNSYHPSRLDYQILYVKHGAIYYLDDGEEKVAPTGSFLFYRPGELQKYHYFLSDKSDVYWVHFAGSSASNFLQAQELHNIKVLTLEPRKKFERLYNSMITNLKAHDDFSNPLNALLIQELILNIAKDRAALHKKEKISSEYIKALRYIDEHIGEKITLQDIADHVSVSTKTLTRHFEKYQNISPIKYVNFTKMEKAKLLLQTDNSISNIAMSLGFDDPLYFSTVFRRFVGLSPEKYRKTIEK